MEFNRWGTLVRFIGPVLFATDLNPFWAYLFNLFLDPLDCYDGIENVILGRPMNCNKGPKYQFVDKSLDLWLDTFALGKSIADSKKFAPVLMAAYLWRLPGLAMYWKTLDEASFIMFPHYFSVLYLWFYGAELFKIELSPIQESLVILLILVVKVMIEWYLHEIHAHKVS